MEFTLGRINIYLICIAFHLNIIYYIIKLFLPIFLLL